MTFYSANYSVISRRQLWVGMRTRDVLMASSLSECVASRLSLYTVVSVSNYELTPLPQKQNNNKKTKQKTVLSLPRRYLAGQIKLVNVNW